MKNQATALGSWHGARLAGIAAALTFAMTMVPAATAAPGGEKGAPESAPNGGPGPQGNPGSDRAQERRARPKAQKTKPHPAKPKSPRAKPRPKAKPKPHPGRGHGRAKHQPETTAPPADQKGADNGKKAGKTTICHSTGSATNPYVEITISDNALKAHARHHDGRDIIPAPDGGCPAGSTEPGTTEATETESGTTEPGTTEPAATNSAERSDGQVLGAHAENPAAAGDEAPESAVAAEQAAATPDEEADGGSLPFTGLTLGALTILALLALAGGIAARRAAVRDA